MSNIRLPSPFVPHRVEIQQAIPGRIQKREFPVRTFKVLGGTQIGIGVLLGIMSLVGVIWDVNAWEQYDDCFNKDYNGYYFNTYYGYYYSLCYRYEDGHTLFAFDVACLIFSCWYVVTGFLPMCMSKQRKSSWIWLKTAFMVCSIIGGSVFVPTMFSLGVVGAFIQERHDSKAMVLSALLAAFSFAELVLAIISASFCCCCSAWETSNQQGIVLMQRTHAGLIPNRSQNPISMTNDQPVLANSGRTANQIVQYPKTQRYQVMTATSSTDQQIQAVGGTQQGRSIHHCVISIHQHTNNKNKVTRSEWTVYFLKFVNLSKQIF